MLHFNFAPFPVLQTERLVLRQLEAGDADEIFFLRSDPGVMKYIDRPPAENIEDAITFIERGNQKTAEDIEIKWGITVKGSGVVVGYLGFWRMQPEHHRSETGYALHPDLQGRGIAGEALKAILDYGFRVMKLHSVEAHVNPANTASIRLLEKNGFLREAYFREDYFFNGKFLNSAVYCRLTDYE